MSEEFQEPAAAEKEPATKTARKRPAVRKSAKPKASAAESAADASSEAPAPAPVRESEPVARVERSERAEEAPQRESQDVIPFVVETAGGEPPGNPKKRRRRKKKKHGEGQGQGEAPQQREASHQRPQHQHPHAVSPPAEAPSQAPEASHAASSAMHAAPRPKLDPEQVTKKAWKIFQSEVGEEGLALIDDHDAREISRRSFRLAEIFLEEAARRGR